jgi:uncharacterized protein (TIGR02996 family)
VEAELLAAICEDPAAQLVYADWLIHRGDPRGPLLVLEYRDRTTPGGLRDPEALTALLWLKRANDGDRHVAMFEGRTYEVAIEGNWVITRAGKWFGQRQFSCPVRISDEVTNVILSVASRSIRRSRTFELDLPQSAIAMRAHPDYRLGPFPRYTSAEIEIDFRRPWTLAARDYQRWYRLWERLVGRAAHDW